METQKTQGFLVFTRDRTRENQKDPVFFGFPPKSKKHIFFGFLLENHKNPRKTKNPKVSGPQKDFGFWMFVVLVSPVVTCDLLNCFLLVSTGILILKRI